jgi:hypothetical protein
LGVTVRRGTLPTDHFTIVPNAYLRDDRLSWDTRGLLAWLMSHTEAFKITEEGMISAGSMRRDGVRRMVRELEASGYLRRDKTFTPGVGTTVDYVLTAPDDGETVVSDDGETVVRAEQGKQDVSAGRPYDGLAVALPIEDQKKTNTKTSSSLRAARSTTTATRIPEGFMPTEEMRRWFADEKLAAVIDGKAEHEKFVDYWLGAPGVKGRKLDWPATWRNWMRTAAERAGRRPASNLNPVSGAGIVPYSGHNGAPNSTTNNKVAQTLSLAQKFHQMETTQ